MSELPEGWAAATLNELLGAGGLFSDGDWVESKDQDPDGSNRLLQLADIGDGFFVNKSSRFVNDEKFSSLNCTEIKEGDVLIARMPDPLGRACLMPAMPQRCLTVVDVAVFRVGESGISNKWLMHFLNSSPVRREIELNSSGTTRKRISRGKLGEIVLPIPPIAEQARIAAKLDELLAQVDTLKARIDGIPALLKRFRQSVLAAAVSGRLTEEWHGGTRKSLEHQPFDYPVRRLGILARFIDYRGKTPEKVDSGIPLITAKNIRPGYISREPREFIRPEAYEGWMTRGIPKIGDVVITTEAPLGNVAVIDIDEKFALAQRAICLQFHEGFMSSFAAIALQSPPLQEALARRSTGTTVKGIKASVLKEIELPDPGIDEQTEIVRRVEQLFAFADQLEARVKAAQVRIDRLTQSILAKAFRGELVPQDPNDEPASVLLERIKAQRAAVPKAKRGRRAATLS